jgi:hypothetical protein
MQEPETQQTNGGIFAKSMKLTQSWCYTTTGKHARTSLSKYPLLGNNYEIEDDATATASQYLDTKQRRTQQLHTTIEDVFYCAVWPRATSQGPASCSHGQPQDLHC